MAKTAVIICGILRDLKGSLQNLNKFIKPLDADVFIHTWDWSRVRDDKWGIHNTSGESADYGNTKNLRERAGGRGLSSKHTNYLKKTSDELNRSDKELHEYLSLYIKPTLVQIDNQELFLKAHEEHIEKLGRNKSHSKVPLINTFSAHYSKYTAHQLMCKHEEKYGIKYDKVFKYRTEVYFTQEEEMTNDQRDDYTTHLIDYEPKPTDDYVIIPGAWGIHDKRMEILSKKGLNFNDTVAWGSRKNMEIYNTSFLRLLELSEENRFNNHQLSSWDLHHNNILIKHIKLPWRIRDNYYTGIGHPHNKYFKKLPPQDWGLKSVIRAFKILCTTPIKHLDGMYEHLKSFGPVDYRPELTSEVGKQISSKDYDIIFCNPNKQTYKLDKNTLEDGEHRFKGTIITASTGLNHIDMDYCDENNIKVLSLTKDYDLINTLPSTAELAFGLILSIVRNIPNSFDDVKDGGWDYDKFMGHQLQDKTIGIIGYGRLGKMMETYCNAFGMTVKIHDPYEGYDDLDSLLKESDIISLHVHVTDKTIYMINKKTLGKLKNNSYIVNTSRGEIVNEKDIVESLRSGKLKGYATDVIEDEYSKEDGPILKGVKEGLNIIVTPHVGGMTWEGQQKAYKWAIDKIWLEKRLKKL